MFDYPKVHGHVNNYGVIQTRHIRTTVYKHKNNDLQRAQSTAQSLIEQMNAEITENRAVNARARARMPTLVYTVYSTEKIPCYSVLDIEFVLAGFD